MATMLMPERLQASTPFAQTDAQAPLPPGPQGHMLVGSLPDYIHDRLGFVTELHKQYGPVAQYRIGPATITQVTSPAGVQQVLQGNNHNYNKQTRTFEPVRLAGGNGLFTSEGDFWLKQRRLMQPAFHRKSIAGFATLMVDHAERMARDWEHAAAAEETIDVAHEMTRITLNIVVKALFGVDVDADLLAPSFTAILEHITFSFQHPFAPPLSVPTPHNRRTQRALETLDETVQRVISQRRVTLERLGGDDPDNCGDLLDMLITMRDADTGEGMSDRQLRDEVVTLFIAGHETTAGMLTWAWYLLSKHPEAARRVRAELAAVLGGRLPTVADLPNLVYLRRVLDETLRLYPPIWVTNRMALGDDTIEGYHVPKGSIVALVPWVTHRLPEIWENPEGFDPDRFAPEEVAKRPDFSYFPFGGGPRFCIGQNFALTEATLVLATLAQRFDMHLVPGRRVQIAPAVTLRPLGGLPMTAHTLA